MKRLFVIGIVLLASMAQSRAVQGLRLSIQNQTDVVLRWPSRAGETFIVAYRPDLQPGTPWTFLTTGHAAAPAGTETTYTHANIVTYPPPGGTGGGTGGPPPSPGAQSMASSSDGSDVGTSPWDKWMYEGRAPYTWELEERPPYPWDPDAQAKRTEPQFFSPDSSTQEASSQSVSALPPVGTMGFYFVTEYEEDLDGDSLPNGFELTIGTSISKADTDGDNINDGAEDADSDGDDNFTEYIQGSDPLVYDSGPLPPLTTGGVYQGEFNFAYTTTPDAQIILGPLLFCNNNITADSLVTTEPTPGNLRLSWNSTFIHYEAFSSIQEAEGAGEITLDERDALRKAYGDSTNMDDGRISAPDQTKMDQLPEHVLRYGQNVASEALRKEFQIIQEVNSGLRQPTPGFTLEQYMKIRLNQIHTQFTRLQSVTASLVRRFGHAVNRAFPYLGGIIILANADSISTQFLSASRDYARDIALGDDETGSAAILSGHCNDLAPGSGNIVLNHLLR